MRRLLLGVVLLLVLAGAALLLAVYPRQADGAILDELNGRPVSHAVVMLRERTLHCDEAGYYRLGWVAGTVTLTVEADGYLTQQVHIPRGQLPGQSVSLTVVLTPNTLSGVVYDLETGAPIAGSSIMVGEVLLATDAQGRYALRRIRSGTSLTASVPGYEVQKAVFSGQETQDLYLVPIRTQVLVLDLYSQQPVANASVVYGSRESTTDADGLAVIKRLLPNSTLFIHAAGYESIEHRYDIGESVSVALRPNTLQGVVRENSAGNPVAGATVKAVSADQVVASAITDKDGRYFFQDVPSPITLTVTALDYERLEKPVGLVTAMDADLQRFEVRGIYLPLGLLTSEKRVLELTDLVDQTELNTIVVDMKTDRGWLAFPSAVAAAKGSKAYQPDVMDVQKFLGLCQEKGIYTIARMVLFKDPYSVAACPDWAVRTADDQLYLDTEGSAWLDPFRAEVQEYLIAMAKEVAAYGFDELQFDYIRFPSDGIAIKAKYSQESTRESRCTTIREFCARMNSELDPYGVLLSADLFGLTVWVDPESDMGIGQRVIDIAPYMDYLSPMLYPATFTAGNLGYDEPMQYPYEIVYRSCLELVKRTKTRLRPWLQHYSWKGVNYGTEELLLEKKAAEDAGTYGWMFWHAGGKYNASVFDPVEGTP